MPKVLVVTDPEMSNQALVDRIFELPQTGFEFLFEHYLTPTSAKDSDGFKKQLREKQHLLAELTAPLIEAGYSVSHRVRIYEKLYETIIHSVEEQAVDFLFKPLRRHSSLRRMLYTATDWNLVRFCPCPMLMVGDTEKVHGRPVLAAVKLDSPDDEHDELNVQVLEQAKLIAGIVNGQVHLATAYNMLTVGSSQATLDPLSYTVLKDRKEQLMVRAKGLSEDQKIPISHLHLVEGAPSMVINQVSEGVNAGIVVVGTVARHGVSGLFIGNTAESLLESCQSDVFVVKTKGFETPIELEGSLRQEDQIAV